MTVSKHEVQPAATDVEQWLDELDPATTRAFDAAPHREILAAAERLVEAERGLHKAVANARAGGYSWAMVGASLGISRQAAQQRFGHQHRATSDVVPVTHRPGLAPMSSSEPQARDAQVVTSTPNDWHVVKNPAGGWDVTGADAKRRSAHAGTQQQAIDRARDIVRNAGGGEVVIHDRQGRIRDRDTITSSKDPKPPRGER